MENFKNDLKVLLSKYPQVKSVSFDITETVTLQSLSPITGQLSASLGPKPVGGFSVDAMMDHLKVEEDKIRSTFNGKK